MTRLRVAIVTNVLPSYRRSFYQRIFALDEFDITVYCQREIPGRKLSTIHHEFGGHVCLVKFWSLKREKLAWQRLPVGKIRSADVVVFYGNPRVLSSVVWATVFRLMGKPIILWGQAHAFRAGRVSEAVRLAWWKLFRYLFVYTDNEVAWLEDRGFDRSLVIGMNNGLDQQLIEKTKNNWTVTDIAEWRQQHGFVGKVVLLSCARLEAKNHFDQIIRALSILKNNESYVWLVIGQGAERDSLETLAAREAPQADIRWLGEIYEEEKLAPWFLSADIFVHPSAIGLSLLHAMGYGLPVVTHGNGDRHNPEFAAFEDGETGKAFNENDPVDLAHVIEDLAEKRELRALMAKRSVTIVTEHFNTDVMAQRFKEIVGAAAKIRQT